MIDGYVDGELDRIRDRELEQHLEGCAECAKLCNSHQALQAAIRDRAVYFTVPAAARQRLRTALRPRRTAHSIQRAAAWCWVGIAASLAIVVILTWCVAPLLQGQATDDLLIQEVTVNHVRSLMVSHLVDIPSSDRHMVKPWFTGKLDFAPSVADLTEQGFPLVGGRLEYLDGRAVAGLVYKRREHVINVFFRPSPDVSRLYPNPISHQGYHLFLWTLSGMTYWVVFDLNNRELQEFVHLLQNHSPR